MSSDDFVPTNLKLELRKRIIEDVIKPCRKGDDFVVLVVDPRTTKILSSCCDMHVVMEAGVLVLQNILLAREKVQLAAIYFLEPCERSITNLIEDFKDPKKPQYAVVHLFFTRQVEDNLMKLIKAARPLISRLKTFKEINADMLAFESRVYHFNRLCRISHLYFPSDKNDLTEELILTAKQISSVLYTMNEFPFIRYQGKHKNCQLLASMVETEMKNIQESVKDWKPHPNRGAGTLLIVDRSIDTLPVLLHEFTYQAMINDLLKVDGDTCFLDGTGKKKTAEDEEVMDGEKKEDNSKILLVEGDELWVEYRHQHIARVMSEVTAKFKEFKDNSRVAQIQASKGREMKEKDTKEAKGKGGRKKKEDTGASVKQLVEAVKQLPIYKQKVSQYNKHLTLAEACMRMYEKKRLKELGTLEQDMATGVDENGERVTLKNVVKQLTTLIQDKTVGLEEKLRLLMIYMISQGAMTEQTRKELMADINLTLQQAVRNLEKLGVDLSVTGTRRNMIREARFAEFEWRAKNIQLHLMRYIPLLHSILKSFATDELSNQEFPYISQPPPSAASSSSSSTKAKKSTASKSKAGKQKKETNTEDTRPRMIVFILGGITFAEMRSTYEIAKETKSNLFIGSSSPVTAIQFIRGLAEADDEPDITKIGLELPKRKSKTADVELEEKKGKGKTQSQLKSKAVIDSDDDDDDDEKETRRKTNAEFRKIKF